MERLQEIETRKNEIRSELENVTDVKKVEELNREVEALNEEVRELKKNEEQETRAKELEQDSSKAKEVNLEEKKMDKEKELKELRNSKKYIDAYAEYIKTGKDEEVRTLLTTNVEGGTIAVPDFVYDEVKTAWDKNDIMSLVRKTEIKGNLKVQFEISGTDAVVHTEGSGAVEEENLQEGIVTISPSNIKKWISISDEVMDLRGEAFLRYIYAELTHRIVKKAADELVKLIAALPQTATATSVSADKLTMAPAAATMANAYAHLSDEANDITVIMNKLTYAKFKEIQYANNYGVDVFEGFRVRFNNELPAYDTAEAGAVYAIVGDLDQGTIANFPNGRDVIDFKFDEMSRKKEDLVEILGKEYVGLGAVANKAFTLLTKPETA